MNRTIGSVLAAGCLLMVGSVPAWAGDGVQRTPFPEPIPIPRPELATPPRGVPVLPSVSAESRAVAQLVEKAKALRAEKDYDAAMVAVLAALTLDEECVPAMTELAWLLNEKKEYDDAITVALTALGLDRRNSDAWRELGYAQMKKENYTKAAEALIKAIDLNPRNWSAYDYLAGTLRKVGLDEEADAVLKIKKERQAQDKSAPKPMPAATGENIA